MPANYRYMFYDVLTNQPNIELPCYGTFFGRQLNRAGNGTASFILDAVGYNDQDIIDATEPGKTKLYVERNGQIIWGGMLWTRTWQEQSKSFSCTFQTLESYFYSQQIETSYSYVNIDQRNILRDLINRMQLKPYANIGLRLPAAFTTGGILRSEVFYDYDGWSYGEAIEYMIKYDTGFDYTIESQWGSDDTPWDTVRVDNVLGTAASITQVAFDYPGNVKNFYYPESAARGGISFLGYGKGEGTEMVRSKYVAPGYLGTGYPDIQRTYDNKDVSVKATLDSQTAAYGKLRSLPVVSPTIEVFPDSASATLGDWQLGDYAKTTIESRRFPGGKELMSRIIGYELTPPKKGEDEKLKLVLQEVED